MRYLLFLLASIAPAAVYTIHPTDAPQTIYTTIEGALCGDTVNIQPGTYSMPNGNLARIYIANKACTSAAPLVIQAADPANKPLFDYTGFPLDGTATPIPGSTPGTQSDMPRGAWQVHGSSFVTIDGIYVKGASAITQDSVAGIRFIAAKNFTVRRSILELNYNGLQGDGVNTVVEANEFIANGKPGSDQQH